MIVISIPAMPPTLNHMTYTIHGRRVVTKEHRAFRQLVKQIVQDARVPDDWQYVSVELWFSPKARYRIDGDNYRKAPFDALTQCGFWSDDSIIASSTEHWLEPNGTISTLIVVRKANVKFRPLDSVPEYVRKHLGE